MAWSKVKNIVILILLSMNLVLAGFSVNRTMQARQTQARARSEAIAFLESREIRMEESEIPRSMELAPMWVSRDVAAERRLAENLLKGGVETEARGAEVYRYSNQNGFIQFHSNGEFSALFSSDELWAGTQTLEEYSQEILKNLELQGELVDEDEREGRRDLTYQEYWRGAPLFNCQVTLTYQGEVLRRISSGKRLVGTPVEHTAEQAGSVATALMRFYNGVSAMGDAYSEIREIVPGYLLTSTIGETMPLSPVWRIKTDVRTYQLDLQTGALSRMG